MFTWSFSWFTGFHQFSFFIVRVSWRSVLLLVVFTNLLPVLLLILTEMLPVFTWGFSWLTGFHQLDFFVVRVSWRSEFLLVVLADLLPVLSLFLAVVFPMFTWGFVFVIFFCCCFFGIGVSWSVMLLVDLLPVLSLFLAVVLPVLSLFLAVMLPVVTWGFWLLGISVFFTAFHQGRDRVNQGVEEALGGGRDLFGGLPTVDWSCLCDSESSGGCCG